jgi:hypothetical protein
MLFGQQNSLAEAIISNITSGDTKINIHGTSGCGKTYLTQAIIEKLLEEDNDYITVTFSGDYYCTEREYYPIISGLNDYIKKFDVKTGVLQGVTKAFGMVPIAGDLLEYISELLLFKKQNELLLNQVFSENELDLLIKIKKLSEKHRVIFYLDNLHWWDRKSFDFLYLLFRHMQKHVPSLTNCVFLCNTTDDQEFTHKKLVNDFFNTFSFHSFLFRKMEYLEYIEYVRMFSYNCTYSDDQLLLLYNLTESHLEVTKQTLQYSPEELLHMDIVRGETTEIGYLQVLIDNRLSAMGATGEQIAEVLKFASLLGYAFTVIELSITLDYHKAELQTIVKEANDIHLIVNEHNKYRFSHEILRELFKQKSGKDLVKYYPKVIACYQELYPSEYNTRIKYLLKLGDIDEIEKLYFLEMVKSKEHSEVYLPNSELEVLLKPETKEFIDIMASAIDLIHHENYQKSIKILIGIEPLFPIEMLAEKDCLLSKCLTKMLDEESRSRAVDILLDYENRVEMFIEKQIWAKTMMHLIIGYIHVGNQKKAKRIQEKLYYFYADHCNICEEYKVKLNILRRKASAFYDVDIARRYLAESTKFFSKGIESSLVKDPRECYMSLVNYGANLLCSGRFPEAYECMTTAIGMSKNYGEIRFPRLYIGINNYLLALFFHKEKKPEKIEAVFETLLQKRQNIADEYLLISNWAVFSALSGNLEKASKLLAEILDEVHKKQTTEASYIYHATTNLAVIYIIQRQYELASDLLQSLNSVVENVYYHSYYQKRHVLLQDAARKKLTYDQNDVAYMLTNLCPYYQSNAWNFFGFTYSLNPLEHWSES